MNMHVPVNARLLRAARLAADIDPSVTAIDLAIERSSVGVQRLGMAAPAVDKLVGAGRDPLIIEHAIKIRSRWGAGNLACPGPISAPADSPRRATALPSSRRSSCWRR